MWQRCGRVVGDLARQNDSPVHMGTPFTREGSQSIPVAPTIELAAESEGMSVGELVDQRRSGAAAELRSALRFKN
jgi:hypothetical protein